MHGLAPQIGWRPPYAADRSTSINKLLPDYDMGDLMCVLKKLASLTVHPPYGVGPSGTSSYVVVRPPGPEAGGPGRAQDDADEGAEQRPSRHGGHRRLRGAGSTRTLSPC
eukprot:2164549-Pyramimonas_sp.AAC.1